MTRTNTVWLIIKHLPQNYEKAILLRDVQRVPQGQGLKKAVYSFIHSPKGLGTHVQFLINAII